MKYLLGLFIAALIATLALAQGIVAPATTGNPNFYFGNSGAILQWVFNGGGIHVPSTNTDWYAWLGYDPNYGGNAPTSRGTILQVATYNWTTGTWAGNYWVYPNGLNSNDIHGYASIATDNAGYVYLASGSHNSAAYVSSNKVANDPSQGWNTSQVSGSFQMTFPALFWSNSKLNLFYSTNGGMNSGAIQSMLGLTTATVSNGVPTWSGSQTNIIDTTLGPNNGWFLPGNFILGSNGDDVYMSWAWAASFTPAVQNAYVGIYKISTGQLRNWNGSTTVAAGSLPIGNVSMQANFKVYSTTTSANVYQPTMGIDASGNIHLIVVDGPASAPAFIHIDSSNSWGTTTTVFTEPSTVQATNMDSAIVPNAAGGMDIYYADGSLGGFGSIGNPNGNIQRKSFNSGVLGAQTLIATAGASPGFALSTPVLNGPNANGRIVLSQVANNQYGNTITGGLKNYLYGDSGYVQRPLGWSSLGPPLGAATNTFDPNNKNSGITLSNGNLTATANATAGGQLVRTKNALSSGKYYAEFTVPSGSSQGFGIANASQSLASGHFLGETGNNSLGIYSSGQVFLNNSVVTTLGVFGTPPSTIRVTLDLTASPRRICFATNGNGWDGDNTIDPAISDATCVSVNAVALPVYFTADVETSADSTVYHNGTYTYSAPIGFVNP